MAKPKPSCILINKSNMAKPKNGSNNHGSLMRLRVESVNFVGGLLL